MKLEIDKTATFCDDMVACSCIRYKHKLLYYTGLSTKSIKDDLELFEKVLI